ncbi:hypothetical protein D9615_005821 [Tricholomella constricta]|uniref:BTB domain-containing protein n=1 Tax=Tricholomella constricta TaxID=117010 RepID=A0A8H5HAV9_9AGAR|nr:hypothetical protein D9615_005821 [Tricholomella constricta]
MNASERVPVESFQLCSRILQSSVLFPLMDFLFGPLAFPALSRRLLHDDAQPPMRRNFFCMLRRLTTGIQHLFTNFDRYQRRTMPSYYSTKDYRPSSSTSELCKRITPTSDLCDDLVDAPDADIVFRSSDNVLFRIHARNLEITTGGFPPAEFSPADQVVDITEDASTLELLFQFVYPRSQPLLEGLPFDTLARLAEAVEKYQVYPAMQICNVYMTKALPDHALDILEYSMRHGYPLLSNRAAPFVTLAKISSSLKSLPPGLLHAWIRYYDTWNAKIRHAILTAPYGHKCANWSEYQRKIFFALGEFAGVKNDESIASVISVPHFASICCKDDANRWQKDFIQQIGDIPPFTKFC